MAMITKIMVPRYKATVKMHAMNCQNCEEHYYEADTGAGCGGMNTNEFIETMEKNKYGIDEIEFCYKVREITKCFSTKRRAAAWASWCVYNEEQFPVIKKLIREDNYGDNMEFVKAYAQVKQICKENFNITLR